LSIQLLLAVAPYKACQNDRSSHDLELIIHELKAYLLMDGYRKVHAIKPTFEGTGVGTMKLVLLGIAHKVCKVKTKPSQVALRMMIAESLAWISLFCWIRRIP
jgi:hypothetical protein